MTATNEQAAKEQTRMEQNVMGQSGMGQAAQEEKHEGFSVETGKVIQGISLVFSGVVTMLEALHPRVSLEPSALLHLITGNVSGLAAIAAENRAQREAESSVKEEIDDADEETGDGAADAVPAADDADAADAADDVPAKIETPATTATISSDDITKIIVRKIKQNRENSKKIEQILKTYGVSKVSELPSEKYEAFVTDLSAI